MSEDIPRSGDTITPNESVNLMRFYSELADLSSEAREAIRAGNASTTLSVLREVNERIAQKFDNIKRAVG